MAGTRRSATLVGGALFLVTLFGTAGAARSDTTFSGLAVAAGISTTLSDPTVVPTGADLGASGPTAQALVDSLGNSRAFASLPYPGDLAVSAPGLARGQGASGVPDYPLYAASNGQGQPTSDVTTPAGYGLHAKSDATSSQASAAGGGAGDAAQAATTHSTANVTASDGAVRAQAESTTEAFEVAGVLRIGRLHALATATGDGNATSAMELGDMTVAGQTVGLTDKGLTTPGGATALPDASPAAAVLQQAGISVRYLAPTRTTDGITSAGVEVRVVHQDSNGTATTVYTLGRAAAFAGGTPAGDMTVADSESTAPPVDMASDVAIAAPNAAPAVEAPVALPATPSKSRAVAPASYRTAPVSSFSATGAYLIIVLAAATCLGGAQLIRYLGVKLAWK